MTTAAELFQALEGTRFVYAGRLVLTLRPGLYPNGRGAIQVEADGEPYCVLTVNVPEVPLADDELLVRTGAESHADVVAVRATVATSRFWTTDGLSVGAGYVSDYATVWKWRRCPGAASPTLATTEGDHRAGHAALCPGCVRAVRERYKNEIERLLAADAERRLRRGRNVDYDEG